MNQRTRTPRRDGAELRTRHGQALLGMGALLMLSACGTASNLLGSGPSVPEGQPGFVRGYLGGVAADEPRAAVIARDVLSGGGSAVDAAVAAGFALTVTMPSRAGLGGGGACLVHDPRSGDVEAVLFPAAAPSPAGPRADRPAAVPMMARGLFALHARGGRQSFEQLIAPAETLARFGTEVSRAFALDLQAVGGPLMADPWARAAFAGPNGQPLAEGARFIQPDLGGTLASLRVSGVGDLYQGGLARRIEEVSPATGAGLTLAALRAGVPQVVPARETALGNDLVATVPDAGGAATLAAFQALRGGADAAAAQRAAEAQGASGPLPASTSLVVADRQGMAVSCTFTMNNLFGTGRVAAGTGILLAAAPTGRVRPALHTPIVIHNKPTRALRHVGAGSGQEGAPLAAALPAASALARPATSMAEAIAAVPEPGRAAALSCARYLPGAADSCSIAIDRRGAGIALGGLDAR